MKYAFAALAVVAGLAAVWFRPPQIGRSTVPPRPSAPALSAPDAHAAPVRVAPLVVYIAGAVRNPGLYRLPPESRADDALRRAGGPLANADLVAVNLAARLNDGDEIAIPKVGETGPAAHSPRRHGSRSPRRAHGRRHRRAAGPRAEVAPAAPIDLNTADAGALAQLPGIGPALAARIVAYREANGPFTSVDELADVNGVDERVAAAAATYLIVR